MTHAAPSSVPSQETGAPAAPVPLGAVSPHTPVPPPRHPEHDAHRHDPAGHAPTAATRHLNAASYLDEDFCRYSLDEVYHQPRRVVAPSFGFDLATVLAHCQRSRRILLVRDAVIVGVIVVGFCLFGPGLLVGLIVLAALHTTRAGIEVLLDIGRWVRGQVEGSIPRMLARLLSLGLGVLALSFASVLLPVFALLTVAAGASAGTVLALTVVGTLIAVSGLCGAPVAAAVVRWRQAVRHGPGLPAPQVDSDERLEAIRVEQAGNATVYSGYSPFVGSGAHLETSGFALRLIRAPKGMGDQSDEDSREFAEVPFTAEDLIGHVRSRLQSLAIATEPEQSLPGLVVTDRVFVAGSEVSQLATYVSDESVSAIILNPVDAARHYLACQVSSWDGELVTSVYVHFALQGKSLYVETSTHALTPCWDGYRIVDMVESLGAWPYVRRAWHALLDAPVQVARAPMNLVKAALRALARGLKPGPNAAQLRRGFDYGAKDSIRELATLDRALRDLLGSGDRPPEVRNEFQRQDIEKYRKIIVRRVVAATLDFLVMRGVDSAEFRQRSNVLINTGIHIGGNASFAGDITNVSGNHNTLG